MVLADIRARPDNGKNHTLLDTQSPQNIDLNTWLHGGARLRILLRMKTSKTSLFAIAGLALLGLVALIQAQQAVPAGVATGFNAIREDSLRADLTFLASDAQGRMSLQTGGGQLTPKFHRHLAVFLILSDTVLPAAVGHHDSLCIRQQPHNPVQSFLKRPKRTHRLSL